MNRKYYGRGIVAGATHVSKATIIWLEEKELIKPTSVEMGKIRFNVYTSGDIKTIKNWKKNQKASKK